VTLAVHRFVAELPAAISACCKAGGFSSRLNATAWIGAEDSIRFGEKRPQLPNI
jgi:hypothetical protein